MSEEIMKLYEGVIWMKGSDELGQRVSVYATGPLEAKKKVQEQYGNDIIVSLKNKEDSERPR
jgi:CRISPR/Cas system type I-B associated protein Csh2 (Cas7 group RAMP superfamily)